MWRVRLYFQRCMRFYRCKSCRVFSNAFICTLYKRIFFVRVCGHGNRLNVYGQAELFELCFVELLVAANVVGQSMEVRLESFLNFYLVP